MRTVHVIARELRRKIGAHYRLIGRSDIAHETYQAARAESDQAESLLRYLAQYAPLFKGVKV